MKGAAYMSGWLAAVIFVILACFSAPAAAHSMHRHAPGAVEPHTTIATGGVTAASLQTHVASAVFDIAPSRAPDTQPCEAPCCTGHGCGCFCAFVMWSDRTFAVTPLAAREPRPGHDRSRPSRAAEALAEPPRSFQ